MGKERNYDDIIRLPHHVSERRPHMPMSDRAAQFSPFAALTGYGAAISETARQTEQKTELDDTQKQLLSDRLFLLKSRMEEGSPITVEYFRADARKSGGAYITVTEQAIAVDVSEGMLRLKSGLQIPFDDIYSLTGNIFDTDFLHEDWNIE